VQRPHDEHEGWGQIAMSRGLGKVERHILAGIGGAKVLWLYTLLPAHPTRATRVAFSRAAYSLSRKGLIRVWVGRCYYRGEGKIIVGRLTAERGMLDQLRPRPKSCGHWHER
jgi:hypothetical protein